MSHSSEDHAISSHADAAGLNPQAQVQSNHHPPSDQPHPTADARGKHSLQRRSSIDRDAQELVISSLRTQVQDLVSQVTQLNNKLVKSYDRVSDLEDDLHVTSSTLRSSSIKISQLELERSQHLSALNTGLLVEKSHVTAELTRLMEKATEEAARRGQAESAQAAIEKDLDDVSAALFDQANNMVVEARLGRAHSERKADDAERALREAEDAVRLMQQQLQSLQSEKEATERQMEGMSSTMGKGKWIERASTPSPTFTHHLLTSHAPYHEYLALLSHLRAVRANNPQPPAVQSLLALSFVARLQLEDTDPTVRLDMASALNWLSRRSIIAAIQSGQLTIEPIATQAVLASATSPQPPLAVSVIHGSNSTNMLSCGLCGHCIVPNTEPLSPTRTGYLSRANSAPLNSWSSSIFRKSSVSSSLSVPPSPPPYHDASSLPAQLYIFRLSEPSPALPSALPLCTSGWCLARLRAACSLWSFVRTGIIEKVWEEEVQAPPPPPRREVAGANIDRPPVPPRRKTKPSGFWGVASTLGLDRVSGWGEGDKDRHVEPEPEKRRFVAPPLPAASSGPSSLGPPPPLPSRNRSRARTIVRADNGPAPRSSSETQSPARHSKHAHSVRREQQAETVPESSPTLSSLLVSSPDEADPLNETFLTPTEEAGPVIETSVRSDSPHSIPLPDSAHDTPVATTEPLPDDTNKDPVQSEPTAAHPEAAHESKSAEGADAPIVVAQPEPSSEHADVHTPAPAVQPADPPSRTGSPAPPPLPRRAAARRAVPPPPPRPATPQATTPPPTSDAAHDIVAPSNGHAEPETLAGPTDKAGSESPVIPESIAIPVATSPIELDGPSAEERAEAVVADTAEPAAPVADVDVDEHGSNESEEKSTTEDPDAPRHAVEPSAEADQTESAPSEDPDLERIRKAAEEKAAESARRGPPPPPPRHPRPALVAEKPPLASILSSASEKSAYTNGKPSKPEEPEFAPDGSPYVGDATWEERAWKELSRLREDMFWARIGSPR
ncbi:hypothetical protein BC834DRAFT_969522 [Gloeopeniophorella convolvens]|nr:hypothetical protein BC834DRAFT_969522 [Gloeopeniophorella convolvens]